MKFFNEQDFSEVKHLVKLFQVYNIYYIFWGSLVCDDEGELSCVTTASDTLLLRFTVTLPTS